MSTLTATLNIPIYHAVVDGKKVNFMDRPKKDGAMVSYLERSKGVADAFGLISKGGSLAIRSGVESSWISHVSEVTGRARTALAIPYLFCAFSRCVDAFKEKNFLNGTRNALEICSSGNFAASLLVTNKAAASVLGGVGGVFKTAVDVIDLGTSVDEFFEYNNLRSKAASDPLISRQVKDGISSKFTTTILKTVRFALAVFTGVLTILAFVFKVAIAKELLIAGAVAAVGSVIFSALAELTTASSKIVPVPKELMKLHVA